MYLLEAQHLVGLHLAFQVALFNRNRDVVNKPDPWDCLQIFLNTAHWLPFR
jgi:hypothetical protein